MPITFFNINSGERKVVDTEPLIAAFYNSGDQHANSTLGQDFGWRLDADTLLRIKEIQSDFQLMNRIASTFQLPLDGVSKTDIVRWISLEDARKSAAERQEQTGKFEREYQERIRALDEPETDNSDKNSSNKQTDSGKMDGSNKPKQEK